MRQGDLHGRVDHATLGKSLHQLGMWSDQQGQWSAAADWYDQAVAKMRQGDILGRVDKAVLLSRKKALPYVARSWAWLKNPPVPTAALAIRASPSGGEMP
jgi:hypothetical protein